MVAFETVDREAVDGGLPFRHHLTHMIVHGFLHLVGYDHQDDDEAEEMERLETAILAALDIPIPMPIRRPAAVATRATGGHRGR